MREGPSGPCRIGGAVAKPPTHAHIFAHGHIYVHASICVYVYTRTQRTDEFSPGG